jgi:hypothetical protein
MTPAVMENEAPLQNALVSRPVEAPIIVPFPSK